MNNKIISSENAPKAIGSYSQAIFNNGFLFISGQLPINPKTNEISSETFKDQTIQIMKNISSILKECNLSFDDIVKTTIYLTDMEHFSEVNKEYANFFTDYFPARATVEVSCLPKKVLVEIEAIAISREK